MKLLLPPGKKFMHISLMAYIENKMVLGRIEDVVHRYRQLDHTQIRPNMPTRLRQPYNQPRPNLLRKLRKFRNRKLLYICGRVYRLKNVAHGKPVLRPLHQGSRVP